MTLIRKLVLVACSALLLTSYLATTNAQNITTGTLDPAQVYYTNNLVNSGTSPTASTSTWQNVGLWNQGLPCWAPGGPVYCGPQPYFNNGSFNFSYGMTDVYQLVNIANALPNSGTGLRVNGFNFGFTAKNGNGWDNGQQDYLNAYVIFYGSNGSIPQSYNYQYATNQQYNWTTFNFSETFATPYASKDLSTVRYGFVGYDTNGWAGPYGPEIYNINFSLKYSVDPCSVDVLSSPSCPGYLDAINKLTPPSPTTTPTTTVTTATSPITSTSPTTSTTTDSTQPTTTTSTSSSAVSAPVVSTSTATTSVTPTATNPQPKVGEVTVSGSQAKTTMSTSQLLSIVRSEQTRIGNLETSTAQQAVEQAQAASDKAQKDSVSISMATISQSQSSSQAIAAMFAANPSQGSNGNSSSTMTNNTLNNSIVSVTPTPNKTSVVDILKQPEINTTNSAQVVTNSKPVEVKIYEPPQVVVETPQSTSSKPQNIYSLTAPNINPQPSLTVAMVNTQPTYTLPKQEVKSQVEEQPKSEGLKFTGTNPILNIINNAPLQNQTIEQPTTTSSVNNKVKDNDLAAGVSLQTMSKQPIGFENYMGVLPDTAFYAPKEIYRNQTVTDNARAQRLLSGASDKLHQEMVNSQYNNK